MIRITVESEVGSLKTVRTDDEQVVVPVHGLGIDSDGPYLRPDGARLGEAAWLKLNPTSGAPSARLRGA